MDQLVAISQATPAARSDHLAPPPHRIRECALRWAGIRGQRHPARALGIAHILAIARGDRFSYRLAEPRRQVQVIPNIRYQPWHLQPECHLPAATIDRYPRAAPVDTALALAGRERRASAAMPRARTFRRTYRTSTVARRSS